MEDIDRIIRKLGAKRLGWLSDVKDGVEGFAHLSKWLGTLMDLIDPVEPSTHKRRKRADDRSVKRPKVLKK